MSDQTHSRQYLHRNPKTEKSSAPAFGAGVFGAFVGGKNFRSSLGVKRVCSSIAFQFHSRCFKGDALRMLNTATSKWTL